MQDLATGSDLVLQAIARGRITPADGETISRILEERRRVIQSVEWESRIAAVEQNTKQGGPQ
jgi:hypothetical protein